MCLVFSQSGNNGFFICWQVDALSGGKKPKKEEPKKPSVPKRIQSRFKSRHGRSRKVSFGDDEGIHLFIACFLFYRFCINIHFVVFYTAIAQVVYLIRVDHYTTTFQCDTSGAHITLSCGHSILNERVYSPTCSCKQYVFRALLFRKGAHYNNYLDHWYRG